MTPTWKPALGKSAEMPRRWGLQGADIHSRLIRVAVLLCASILIEECAFGRSTSCYAAAPRFTPDYEAFLPNQHGRRLHVADVQGKRNSESLTRNKGMSPELQEATELKKGKPKYAGVDTSADVAHPTNSAGGVSVDIATAADPATEKKLSVTSRSSSFDTHTLQRLRHQLPSAPAAFLGNRSGVMRVPPKDSETLRSADALVGSEPEKEISTSSEGETSRSAVTRAPRAEDTSALIAGRQPAGAGDHHAALKQPGAELAAPAGEPEDRGSTGIKLTSPPLSGLEAFANSFHSPSALHPSVHTAPTDADPGAHVTPRDWLLPLHSHDISGDAVDAASKWEELSRQHQHMLLSRNLTSVIKLFVDFTQPDHMTPWQMRPPRHSTGSAFVVDGRLLLTNGHLVNWQTRVLARRHGNARKFNASLVAVGHDCDLALLTVEAEEFWDGLQPLAFGEIPQLRDTVTVLGYPTGGDQLSITEGVVSRIGMSKYAHSSYELLTVQIDAAINPGNSGGPALVAGKVVGVAFQGFSELQSVGYIVPYPVIRHFLNDLALHKRFTGFPTLGIKAINLENQGMKEYKKLTSIKPSDLPEGITATGVVVVDVDSLRKERYLNGMMRLPYGSTILPPDTQIRHLLPEDPTQKVTLVPTPPSLRQPRLTGLLPETADSLASLPFVGVHATASFPTSAAVGGSGAAPDGDEHRSASLVARGTEPSEAASAFVGPRGDRRGQQQEKDDEREQRLQVEKNQQLSIKTEKQENKPVTSEDDLIVPNVHYNAQQVWDVDDVGFEVGDVILAIDGIDVADDGTVPFRGMERNELEFTLMNRFNGEGVKALVLRNGKLMNILAPLTIPNVMIPLHTWDMKPKYFVFGGLVFVQLTKMLMDHARCTEIPSFVFAMTSRMDFQEREKDEIIVLSLILPSELTIGYSGAPSVVRKVQGYAIRNFEEMVQLVEECTDPFIEFIVEVEGCKEVPIVLDRKKAVELNPKIREQHGIPHDRSVFL